MILFGRQPFRCFLLFLLCVSLLFTCGPVDAGNQETNRDPYTPERIILNVTEDPSASQAVTWRSGTEVSNPQAQIAPATGSPDFGGKAGTVHAATETVKTDRDRVFKHHSVVFKTLKSNTKYAYRVGDRKHWSEWNQFKTAKKGREPFRFIYFGDPQEDIRSMCSRIFREAYKKAPDAAFWHFAGDLVDNGDKDEEWAELFYAFGWIPRMTPMIFLPGNHSYPNKRFIRDKKYELFHLWRPHFTLPENGPDGLKETVYFIDYQGVRFVMLNGNEKIEEQARWMDTILSRNPQPWTIAAIHQPVYSTGRRRDHPVLQNLLIPVFDKYSVDLVLQGHDHTYGRTYKLKKGTRVADNEKGTVYIVSVSGPKFYSINRRYENLMIKLGTGTQLFQVIHIDRNHLRYESYSATGELYDSFDLEK